MPTTLDEDSLLTALLSGGIIGGSVALVDKNFERSKYAIPAGMILGVFLDYQLKKMRKSESIEVSKSYFEYLADLVAKEPVGFRLPDANPYWSAMTTSLAGLATLGLAQSGSLGAIGQYFTSAVVPRRLLAITNYAENPEALPQAQFIPENDVGGNRIRALFNPTTLQIMAAFTNPNNIGRSAGAALCARLVNEAIERSDILNKIAALYGEGAFTQIEAFFVRFKDEMVNGLSVVNEQSMITNERIMLMQNPEGTQSVALLMNGEGQNLDVPAVRMNIDNWRQIHQEVATRLNITPAHQPRSMFTNVVGDVEFKDEFVGSNLSQPLPPVPDATLPDQMHSETIKDLQEAGLSQSEVERAAGDSIHANYILNQLIREEVVVQAQQTQLPPRFSALDDEEDVSSSYGSDGLPPSFRPADTAIPDGWTQLQNGMYSNGINGQFATRMFAENQWDDLMNFVSDTGN